MSLESNMPVATFLLDAQGVVKEWAVRIEAVTTDLEFLRIVRNVSYDLMNQGLTILRIEVNDKGAQSWLTVTDVLS